MMLCSIRMFALTIAFMAGTMHGLVHAQDQVPSQRPTPLSVATALNAETDSVVQRAKSVWHAEFQRLRDPEGLRSFVERFSTWGQKIDMVATWPGGPDRLQRQIREYFRENVGDDRRLVDGMKEYAKDCVLVLRDQDRLLMQYVGRPLGSQQTLCQSQIKSDSWDAAFDPVMARAVKLSQDGAIKTLGVAAGSNVLADGINDVARANGANSFKDGSTGDRLTDFFVNVVVGWIADEATDPTDSFCQTLDSELADVEQTLLNGPDGLIAQLKAAAEQHKQARLKVVR